MKGMELAPSIWYFTNIYKNVELIWESIEKLKWQPWNRYNGIPIGQCVSVPTDGGLLDKSLNISRDVFAAYCQNTGFNFSEYKTAGSVHLKKWDYPNNGISPHTDYTYTANSPEKIIPEFTLSYYLNDNYIGGLIEFPDYNISLKPEAGSVVVFPCSIPHSVTDLIDGYRFHGQEFVFKKDFIIPGETNE